MGVRRRFACLVALLLIVAAQSSCAGPSRLAAVPADRTDKAAVL